MGQTVRAVFDGEALRPDRPVNLRPNTAYLVTIEGEAPTGQESPGESYPLTEISRLATDMGVTDLAASHARYARRRADAEEGGS
jgi:hypothetical protein